MRIDRTRRHKSCKYTHCCCLFILFGCVWSRKEATADRTLNLFIFLCNCVMRAHEPMRTDRVRFFGPRRKSIQMKNGESLCVLSVQIAFALTHSAIFGRCTSNSNLILPLIFWHRARVDFLNFSKTNVARASICTYFQKIAQPNDFRLRIANDFAINDNRITFECIKRTRFFHEQWLP